MNIWKNKQFLTYFGILYIANLAAISASNTIFLSSISLDLMGANKTFIAFIIALPRYMIIVLSLLTYKIMDRVNKRLLITIGSFTGIIAFIGLAYSKSYIALVGFGMLYGVAYMVASTYITAMLLEYTPVKDRIGVLGIFTTSSSLASFFGPYLTGIILKQVIMNAGENAIFPQLSLWGMFPFIHTEPNPNLMFLSGVIYYLIVGVFLRLAQIFCRRMEHIDDMAKPLEYKEQKSLFSGYTGLVSLDILLGGMWMSLMTFIPAFDNSIGSNQSIWFFSGFSIVGLVGRLVLAPHLGAWKPIYLVNTAFGLYFLCFIFVLVFGYFPIWWILLLIGSIQGLAHGVIYPTMNILFTRKNPYMLSRSTLAFVVLFQTGTMLGIPLGRIVDIWGYEAMFTTALIGSICIFTYCMNRPGLKNFLNKLK